MVPAHQDEIEDEIWTALNARFRLLPPKSAIRNSHSANRKMAFSPEAALNYLKRAHEQDRLAHAYLISGSLGSGKRKLAASLAGLVNATKPEDVFSPRARDIFLAEPESKSRRIVVEQVRELSTPCKCERQTADERWRLFVEADRLQPQAANAFLKTLEEPPDHSLLLLLSALPEVLPDTIISRCVPIPLAAVEMVAVAEEGELVELLRDIAREQSWSLQQAYRLAQGLQRLLGGIREEIKAANAEMEKQEQARYRNSTDGRWLAEREDYYKALSESQYLRRRAHLSRPSSPGGRTSCARAAVSASSTSRRWQRKRWLWPKDLPPAKCFAGSGGWRSCAITSAATSRKRWQSRWRFYEFLDRDFDEHNRGNEAAPTLRSRHEKASDVGRGHDRYSFMGRAHSNAWRQAPRFFDLPAEIRMKTICGRNRRSTQRAADSLGWENAEADWKRAVADPEIDIVDVCTPNDTCRDCGYGGAGRQGGLVRETPGAVSSRSRADVAGRSQGAGNEHDLPQLPPRTGDRPGESG